MKFMAIITHRSFGDADGKGWPAPSVGKEFTPMSTILDVWNWYEKQKESGGGLLEIIKAEEE